MEKLKVLVFAVIVVAALYYGWNMIPPYFHNYQFQDDLDDICRVATYNPRGDEDLKAAVISKARTRDITLKEDQISITRMPSGIGIAVKYRVHVETLIHSSDIDFVANSKNMNIIASP